MDDVSAVQDVRSFNRTVTQRVGALQDEYLASGRGGGGAPGGGGGGGGGGGRGGGGAAACR
jgi:hypothetical protein